MSDKKITLLAIACLLFACAPFAAIRAINGTNAKNAEVDIEAKLGDAWFTALNMRADKNGILEIKDVVPGWYKFIIDEDDIESSQTLAAKIKMLDNKGRRIKEKTAVELSVKVDDTTISLGEVETDDKGWLNLQGLSSDTAYKLEIDEDDDSSVKQKNGVRIKVKAKIDKSDWFPTAYKRTDEGRVFEVENVLPGKYKFKYKSGDAGPSEPFTLKMRLRNEDGEKIKEPVDVELYAYIDKTRIPVGTMTTDYRGWLVVPGVMTDMKYKIKVKD